MPSSREVLPSIFNPRTGAIPVWDFGIEASHPRYIGMTLPSFFTVSLLVNKVT